MNLESSRPQLGDTYEMNFGINIDIGYLSAAYPGHISIINLESSRPHLGDTY